MVTRDEMSLNDWTYCVRHDLHTHSSSTFSGVRPREAEQNDVSFRIAVGNDTPRDDRLNVVKPEYMGFPKASPVDSVIPIRSVEITRDKILFEKKSSCKKPDKNATWIQVFACFFVVEINNSSYGPIHHHQQLQHQQQY